MPGDNRRDMSPQLAPILILPFFVMGETPGQDPSTAQERMESWQTHQQLEEQSRFRDLSWRALGPRFQGGRIESIAVPSGPSSVIYAGVGSGNLWKSENHGDSVLILRGTVENGTTAGDLVFRWAQNQSNANATTVKRGSYMTGRKM